jgi:hypothetical protein
MKDTHDEWDQEITDIFKYPEPLRVRANVQDIARFSEKLRTVSAPSLT